MASTLPKSQDVSLVPLFPPTTMLSPYAPEFRSRLAYEERGIQTSPIFENSTQPRKHRFNRQEMVPELMGESNRELTPPFLKSTRIHAVEPLRILKKAKVPEAASTGFIDTQPSSSSRYPRRITPKQPVGRPYLNEGHPGNRVVSLPNHLKDEALESALLEFDPHHAPDPIQNRVVSMPEYFISQSPRSPSPNHMHSRNRKEPPDFEPLIDFSSPCQEGELSAELSRSELPSDFSQGSLIDYGSPITPPQHERTVELSTDYGQSDVSSVIFIMEPPTHRTPVYPGASQDRAVKPPKDYFKKEPNTFVADLPTSTGGTQTGGDFWGSPPRPIPALHGPSSLPYARCPSGAEGVILSEPLQIPSAVWGLNYAQSASSNAPTTARPSRSNAHMLPQRRDLSEIDRQSHKLSQPAPSPRGYSPEVFQLGRGSSQSAQSSETYQPGARSTTLPHRSLPQAGAIYWEDLGTRDPRIPSDRMSAQPLVIHTSFGAPETQTQLNSAERSSTSSIPSLLARLRQTERLASNAGVRTSTPFSGNTTSTSSQPASALPKSTPPTSLENVSKVYYRTSSPIMLSPQADSTRAGSHLPFEHPAELSKVLSPPSASALDEAAASEGRQLHTTAPSESSSTSSESSEIVFKPHSRRLASFRSVPLTRLQSKLSTVLEEEAERPKSSHPSAVAANPGAPFDSKTPTASFPQNPRGTVLSARGQIAAAPQLTGTASGSANAKGTTDVRVKLPFREPVSVKIPRISLETDAEPVFSSNRARNRSTTKSKSRGITTSGGSAGGDKENWRPKERKGKSSG